MLDCIKNLVTSSTFLTVISGVFVFALSQLFNEYWIKPIQKYKKLRAKISYYLTLYANMYMNPVKIENINDDIKSASYEFRKLAAEVDAMIELKPWFFPLIKGNDILREVSKNLIGLSNNFGSHDPEKNFTYSQEMRDKICSLLELGEYNW